MASALWNHFCHPNSCWVYQTSMMLEESWLFCSWKSIVLIAFFHYFPTTMHVADLGWLWGMITYDLTSYLKDGRQVHSQ